MPPRYLYGRFAEMIKYITYLSRPLYPSLKKTTRTQPGGGLMEKTTSTTISQKNYTFSNFPHKTIYKIFHSSVYYKC